MAKAPTTTKTAKPAAAPDDKTVRTDLTDVSNALGVFVPDPVRLNALKADLEQLASFRKVSVEEMSMLAIEAGTKALLAEPATDAAPPPVAAPGEALVSVTGPKAGRWRARHHFNSDAKVVSVDPDTLKALQADPTLAVTPVKTS